MTSLAFTTEWHALGDGAPEERAAFCALGLRVRDVWLTEARDRLANTVRTIAFLDANALAEWIGWNWWRLRWEPRFRGRPSQDSRHNLSSIGAGYIWPDVSFYSDADRTWIASRRTEDHPATPLRYLNDFNDVIPASDFERGIDGFLHAVSGRLEAEGLRDTNLHAILRDLAEERGDEDLAARRKLEAILGYDPDEADPKILERLEAEAETFGRDQVEELAAARRDGENPVEPSELVRKAEGHAIEASIAGMIRTAPATRTPRAFDAANDLALRVRRDLGLGTTPASNQQLADACGVRVQVVANGEARPFRGWSYAIDRDTRVSGIVLASRREDSRRFALARLLADRLQFAEAAQLRTATDAVTYRQQFQRAFAAELLCPLNALRDFLGEDYSDDRRLEAAQHFQISPLVVTNVLVNNGLMDSSGDPSDAADRMPFAA